MFFNRCPSPEALSEYAAHGGDSPIQRHVQSCAKCSELLTQLRRDEELARQVRGLYGPKSDELSPSVRARLMRMCSDVAREAGVPKDAPREGDAPRE